MTPETPTEATIRRALPGDAARLSELAMRSKAVWGYDAQFMAACRDELTLSPGDVETLPTFLAEIGCALLGFYSLEPLSDGTVELGHLFVEPEAIGRGVGRRLIEHAKRQARTAGYATMVIQGDPNAERFYRVAGGRLIGTKESLSIPGRMLPLFHLDLLDTTAAEAP